MNEQMCSGADKSLARPEWKQANVCQNGVFPSAPCLAGKKTWWQLASRCCWNSARPWHASELVSFLVGLRTYIRMLMKGVVVIIVTETCWWRIMWIGRIYGLSFVGLTWKWRTFFQARTCNMQSLEISAQCSTWRVRSAVMFNLTFQSPAVSLRITRSNTQKFYMVLALRWVFCANLRTNSDFYCMHH